MRTILVFAAAVAGLAAAGAASAQIYGGAGWTTKRMCTSVGPGQDCAGAGPGQAIVDELIWAGYGAPRGFTWTSGAGNRAQWETDFNAGGLPIVRARTNSAADARVNANVFAFQSLTYTGAAGSPFSISGTLDINDSSTNPLGGARPGGAIYSFYLGIWDPAILAGLVPGFGQRDWFNRLFYATCSTPGVLGFAVGSGSLPGGPASFTQTTSGCGGPLLLTPGQEVLVVAGLQLPVNRGGFADAFGTLVTRLGDDLPDEVRGQLAETLLPAQVTNPVPGGILAVPEPGTWALLIAGFGLVGSALRRRAPAPA